MASLLAACATGAYDVPDPSYAEWKRKDARCRREATDEQGGLGRDAYARCMRRRDDEVRPE